MLDSTQFKRQGLRDTHLFSNMIRDRFQGAKWFLGISGLRIEMKTNTRFAVPQMLRMVPADIRERIESLGQNSEGEEVEQIMKVQEDC